MRSFGCCWEVLNELYERNPCITKKGNANGHLDFVHQQLRPAFACLHSCFSGKKDEMIRGYLGFKFNISNFKKGCLCRGGWDQWKISS
jgi:hypothetical protein